MRFTPTWRKKMYALTAYATDLFLHPKLFLAHPGVKTEFNVEYYLVVSNLGVPKLWSIVALCAGIPARYV